jgi:hypothetical protein
VRTPDRYLDAIRAGASPEAGDERLDAGGRALEALQLALRTRAGVPRAALDPEALAALEGLVAADPARPDHIVLTLPGRLLANEVAVRLRVPVEAGAAERHRLA